MCYCLKPHIVTSCFVGLCGTTCVYLALTAIVSGPVHMFTFENMYTYGWGFRLRAHYMIFQILKLLCYSQYTFFLVIHYLVAKSGANTIGLSGDQVYNCKNFHLEGIQTNRYCGKYSHDESCECSKLEKYIVQVLFLLLLF